MNRPHSIIVALALLAMFGIVNLAIGNTAYTDDSIHPVITDLQDFIGSESFDAGLGEFASYVVSGEDWIWIDSDGNPPGCAFFRCLSGQSGCLSCFQWQLYRSGY